MKRNDYSLTTTTLATTTWTLPIKWRFQSNNQSFCFAFLFIFEILQNNKTNEKTNRTIVKLTKQNWNNFANDYQKIYVYIDIQKYIFAYTLQLHIDE